MRYNIDDFVDEYRGPYDAAIYKAKALNIQNVYISSNPYVVNGVTRYGLYINPDAAGLAYWTDLCLTNNWDITTPAFLTTIFAAADTVTGYYTRSREAFKWWNTDVLFSDRSYGSEGFLLEFVAKYNADVTKFADQALKVLIVYSSNYPFTLSNGQIRYGMFRLPDAEGLAYWTNDCIVNNRAADSAAFWDVFFATIAASGSPSASRALTSNKSYEGSIAFVDKNTSVQKYGLILPNYSTANQGFSYVDRIYYAGGTVTNKYYTAPTYALAKQVVTYISPAIDVPATTIPQFPAVTGSVNKTTKTITVTMIGGNVASYILVFVR